MGNSKTKKDNFGWFERKSHRLTNTDASQRERVMINTYFKVLVINDIL